MPQGNTFKNHTVTPFDNVIAYDCVTANILWEEECAFHESLAKGI